VQKENLTELMTKPDDSYRLYIGNAGWAAGQLEAEMKEGSWLIVPANAELIFYDGDDLWDTVRAEVASVSLIGRLGIKHAPHDPRLN
jgi:putative transcriptional regulator